MDTTTAQEHATPQGPLPLVIGVAGHLGLRPKEREVIEAQVRRIFDELGRKYPATPLVLLSPLDEGAGQLAARVALECGARLLVPQAEYEREFSDPPRASRNGPGLSDHGSTVEQPRCGGTAHHPAQAGPRRLLPGSRAAFMPGLDGLGSRWLEKLSAINEYI